jgi:hypothetical protein
MQYDPTKVDELTLAMLYLNVMMTGVAWKGLDWDALDRLHTRGLISNPKSKAKSVRLTEEGAQLAEAMFNRHLGKTAV